MDFSGWRLILICRGKIIKGFRGFFVNWQVSLKAQYGFQRSATKLAAYAERERRHFSDGLRCLPFPLKAADIMCVISFRSCGRQLDGG